MNSGTSTKENKRHQTREPRDINQGNSVLNDKGPGARSSLGFSQSRVEGNICLRGTPNKAQSQIHSYKVCIAYIITKSRTYK